MTAGLRWREDLQMMTAGRELLDRAQHVMSDAAAGRRQNYQDSQRLPSNDDVGSASLSGTPSEFETGGSSVVNRVGLGAAAGVVAALLGAAACSSGSSGLPRPTGSGPCPAKPQGGALCIKVLTTKPGVVGDVIGYLSST